MGWQQDLNSDHWSRRPDYISIYVSLLSGQTDFRTLFFKLSVKFVTSLNIYTLPILRNYKKEGGLAQLSKDLIIFDKSACVCVKKQTSSMKIALTYLAVLLNWPNTI